MNTTNKDNDLRLDAFIEEYKEMRNEIRASYGQFFSILFGIILTGIGAAFYHAFEKKWLFLLIPFMIMAWINIVTFIRSNIQHISSYLVDIEKRLNKTIGFEFFFYETKHAKKLWFSKLLLILASMVCIPLIMIYVISIDRAIQYLKIKPIIIFGYSMLYLDIMFVAFTTIITVATIALFILMPKKYYKHATEIQKSAFEKATGETLKQDIKKDV